MPKLTFKRGLAKMSKYEVKCLECGLYHITTSEGMARREMRTHEAIFNHKTLINELRI